MVYFNVYLNVKYTCIVHSNQYNNYWLLLFVFTLFMYFAQMVLSDPSMQQSGNLTEEPTYALINVCFSSPN